MVRALELDLSGLFEGMGPVMHLTWRPRRTAIPPTREGRMRRLAVIEAELERPVTPEAQEEDRRRIAEKVAEIEGMGGLFRRQ